MKKIFFILLAAVMTFAACTTPEYKTLPIDEFEKVIAQPDVIVVDVRTPEEYAEGHIPGAINIDWKAGHFAEQAEVLLDKDKTIALRLPVDNRLPIAVGWHGVTIDGMFFTLFHGLRDSWAHRKVHVGNP